MNRPLYAQRLNRDVSELFSNNFNCSGSTLTVLQTSDSLQAEGCLVLRVTIFEGPYRRGTYAFGLNIPENYPFRPVEIFAKQPIWHPNIDLFTGKVALPIEWSPVLTLNSIAVAVQVNPYVEILCSLFNVIAIFSFVLIRCFCWSRVLRILSIWKRIHTFFRKAIHLIS